MDGVIVGMTSETQAESEIDDSEEDESTVTLGSQEEMQVNERSGIEEQADSHLQEEKPQDNVGTGSDEPMQEDWMCRLPPMLDTVDPPEQVAAWSRAIALWWGLRMKQPIPFVVLKEMTMATARWQ